MDFFPNEKWHRLTKLQRKYTKERCEEGEAKRYCRETPQRTLHAPLPPMEVKKGFTAIFPSPLTMRQKPTAYGAHGEKKYGVPRVTSVQICECGVMCGCVPLGRNKTSPARTPPAR